MKNIIRIGFLFALLLQFAAAELRSQLYELPSLIVESDQLYLQRKSSTNLTCELSAGYSEARILSVTWIKDRELLPSNDSDYTTNKITLSIHGTKQQNEGEYQCLAEISRIRLSNRQLITTKLISSPLKLRRARITKFDNLLNHAITVRENEVARLPCAGIPDVIPGPPTICFQRLEHEECLGTRNDTKYLTTNSGMQISLVQPSDAGFYHCVVRNDYTNQTRKSPKPVLLYVRENNNTDKARQSELSPSLIYPARETGVDKPIDLDVAEGDDVILECVISLAKIVWIKHNDTTPVISMNDNNSRFQQVWGNLRIKSVAHGDSGIYSCVGLPIIGEHNTIDENTRPRIDYNLIVHSPTGVHLSISPQMDTSYMLECLATNLRYEIPMAYVNGSSLIKSIDKMGIPSNTNFYTNPIRVQLQVRQTFSGSVQCISRPAMEEAEIYGNGLERGKSMNMFVMSSHSSNELIIQGPSNLTVEIGKTADLPCVVQRVKTRSWTKNNRKLELFTARRTIVGSNSMRLTNVQKEDEGWYTCAVQSQSGHQSTASAYLKVVDYTTPAPFKSTTTEPFLDKKKEDKIDVEDVRGFVTGTEVRIQWSVLGKMEALTKIANFVIEVQRSGANEDVWIEADTVDSHVRATTIKNLIADNKYKFRIKLIRDKGSTVISQPTNWMNVEQLSGDVLPSAPKIDKVYMHSSDSAKVYFSHNVVIDNAAAKTFVIVYGESGQNKSRVTQVDGSQNEAIITGLSLDRQYAIRAVAENAAGKSLSSNEFLFNTTHSGMFSTIRIYFDSLQPHLTFKNIALAGIVTTLAFLILLICFVVFCNLRSGKGRSKNQANGKFLDTSYRIFNEQKVHKSRIFDDTNDIIEGDVDECSPLKVKQFDERESDDSEKYGFNKDGSNLPNLYGNIDDIMDVETNAEAPNDPTYVSSKLGPEFGVHSARCYSPESRTSHEMLVSYSRSVPHSNANSASPQMNGSMQRVKAYNYPDSLLYSPAGTSSSIAETSSSGIAPNHRLTCDSPAHAQSDESDQGIRCGGSSRNSHISSTDGSKIMSMGTFKGSTPTSSFVSTFDRRRSENVA